MNRESHILIQTARALLPVLLVLALVTYYRGHHLPGGGFIGGLLAASGFALVALGEGVSAARRTLRISPTTLMTLGLSVAFASAMIGLFATGTLLAGLWLPEFNFPVLGSVHLGTPMLFDAGVLLTVTGFSVQVTFSLMESEP